MEYLRAGRSLTPQTALVNLNIRSLTSRISELRALGFNIVVSNHRDFYGSLYRKYRLGHPEKVVA